MQNTSSSAEGFLMTFLNQYFPEVSTTRAYVPPDYFTIPDLYVIGVVKYVLFGFLASSTYHYVCEMHPDFSLGHSPPTPIFYLKYSHYFIITLNGI